MKVISRIPNWRYPEASERALSRRLQDATRDLVVEMRDSLDRLKFDATNEEITEAQDDIESHALEIFTAVIAALFGLGVKLYRFNSAQWLVIALATGGNRNPAVLSLDAFGANGSESWYNTLMTNWHGLAEDSIKKLSSDIVADWSIKVKTENAKGATREQIDEVIDQRYGVYKSWSKNRAAGIIGTFNSMLMRQRLGDAGVSHYYWFGKMDERERATHVALEGKRRPVSGPGIFPGEEYGCRCWSVPDFDDVEVPDGEE